MSRPPLTHAAALACALALSLASCGGSSGGGKEAQATTAPAAPCTRVAVPGPKREPRLTAPRSTLDPSRAYTATVVTNCGAFSFRLDVRRAPRTASSFYSLARHGFYDGTQFHRVARGFVIQGGDPKGDGTGGPGYRVVERPPADASYTRGVVAMAKAGNEPPGASGSQFFVVTGEDAGLPPEYALLGRVTSGQAVVDRIGALPTEPPGDGRPSPPVVISKLSANAS